MTTNSQETILGVPIILMRVDQAPLVDNFVVESRFLDVLLDTSYVPYPTDEECQPLQAEFSVDDLTDKISFEMARSGQLLLDFSLDTCLLDTIFEFKWPETRLPYYDGSYVVDPSNKEKVLFTKDKSMAGNVIVNPISYEYVENEAGGYTFKIGKP